MPVIRSGPLSSSVQSRDLQVSVAADGTVSGKATAGARVEVANLSTAATGHLLPEDAVEIGVEADPSGRFAVKLPSALGGDVLQVQVRASSEEPIATAVQVRVDASNRANDPRAAFVSLKRIDVDVEPNGLVLQPRTRLPLSEPDAVLRFTNTRTGESVDVVVDPVGRFTPTRLPGREGDIIDVAITDDLATRAPASAGTLVAKTPAVTHPEPLAKDAGAVRAVTIPGRLFLDEVLGRMGLGKQGAIGNCPVPAAASAIAAVDPDAIREMIRQRADGHYVVTFHPAGQAAAAEIVVDDKLYARGQSPVYGAGAQQGGEAELWFPLVEKAYAALVGGYEVLGRGTSVGKVMSDMLGRDTTELWLKGASPDHVWERLLRARANRQAMACGTYPSSESALYRGTGLYANHAYSVIGLEEKNGERLVTMRNPWGGSAGFSGEFQLKLDDFVRLYQVLNIC